MLEEKIRLDRRDRRDLELLRRYRAHDDAQAYDELVRRYTRLVRSFARRYAERGEQLDDLVQVGMVGLVKAINRFDLQSRRRFVTFAAPNVTGEIKRHFRDHVWALHVPRGMKELQAKATAERNRAEAEGRTLGVPELAERLDVGETEALEALRAADCFRTDSLAFPAGEDRELLDTIGQSDPGYAAVEQADQLADALEALDERQREVIELRFGGELLQREIGAHIGVSQMQTSRLLEARLMRDRLERADPAAVEA